MVCACWLVGDEEREEKKLDSKVMVANGSVSPRIVMPPQPLVLFITKVMYYSFGFFDISSFRAPAIPKERVVLELCTYIKKIIIFYIF